MILSTGSPGATRIISQVLQKTNVLHVVKEPGSDLYAGGWFTTAGGSAANYIAKWNGSIVSRLTALGDRGGWIVVSWCGSSDRANFDCSPITRPSLPPLLRLYT